MTNRGEAVQAAWPIALERGMRRDAARLRVPARAVGLDIDDLLQAGRLAALQAMPRWDASRGVQMATFLGRRARGGMLDEIERWHRMRSHGDHRAIKNLISHLRKTGAVLGKQQATHT